MLSRRTNRPESSLSTPPGTPFQKSVLTLTGAPPWDAEGKAIAFVSQPV
jgi:hypothetical protein